MPGEDPRIWLGGMAQELFGGELVLGDVGLAGVLTNVVNTAGSVAGGGTREIQRNIIGERILGLLKDPGVDSETPSNQIRFLP